MTHANSIVKSTFIVTLFILLLLDANGCGGGGGSKPNSSVYKFSSSPRMRMGSYPTSTLGTTFLGPDLGSHGYSYNSSEGDGIVYTCRAGHVDIIHLRISADWTAYLTMKTFNTLTTGGEGFYLQTRRRPLKMVRALRISRKLEKSLDSRKKRLSPPKSPSNSPDI